MYGNIGPGFWRSSHPQARAGRTEVLAQSLAQILGRGDGGGWWSSHSEP